MTDTPAQPEIQTEDKPAYTVQKIQAPARPRIRSTHTIVELEVSAAAYNEIRSSLEAAGYQHAFLEDGVIDMSGIGVMSKPTGEEK